MLLCFQQCTRRSVGEKRFGTQLSRASISLYTDIMECLALPFLILFQKDPVHFSTLNVKAHSVPYHIISYHICSFLSFPFLSFPFLFFPFLSFSFLLSIFPHV